MSEAKSHSWDKFLLDKPLPVDKRGFFDVKDVLKGTKP